MGSYENLAVRDMAGNIIGYSNIATGEYSQGTGLIKLEPVLTVNVSSTPPYSAPANMQENSPYMQHLASQRQFDPNSAAGIAQEIAKSGGKTTEALAERAAEEGFQGTLNVVRGMETLPTPSKVQLPTSIRAAEAGPTADIYVPLGDYSQTLIPNAKAVVSESGEIGIYQPVYIGGQVSRNLGLIGGGGRAALQSGAFSINEPLTTRVYGQEETGKFTPLPASAAERFSRLGAEAYGGYAMQPLDTRTIESTGARLSTYATAANLAGLVSPEAVNLSKAELPGAKIPFEISAASPTIQFADQYGLTGDYINVMPSPRLISPAFVEVVTPSQFKGIGPTITEKPGAPTVKVIGMASDLMAPGEIGTPFSYVIPAQPSLENFASNFVANVANIFGANLDATKGFEKVITVNTKVSESTIPAASGIITIKSPATTEITPIEGRYLATTAQGLTTRYEGGDITARSTTQEISTKTEPSLYEKIVSDPLRAFTMGTLPEVPEAVKVASQVQYRAMPVTGPIVSTGLGAYEGIRESPGEAVKNAVIGAAFLAGGELIGGAAAAASAGTRLAPAVSTVGKYIPPILGTIYAGSVGYRATEGGTELGSSAAERFGGILSTETIPMIAGAGALSAAASARVPEYSIAKTMAGEIEGVTITRPGIEISKPWYSTTAEKVRSIDVLKGMDVARTYALDVLPEQISARISPEYRAPMRIEDIYTITAQAKESPMSVSGMTIPIEITKVSQVYERPSFDLPMLGKTYIPFMSARPVGEPVGPIKVSAEALGGEYALARLPETRGITGDFFAREYIVRTSEIGERGYIKGREETFGAEARIPEKGTAQYMSAWDIAGEVAGKTGKTQIEEFNKIIGQPEGYRTGSMAFGKIAEGVTLENVWQQGRVITEARAGSPVQIRPIADISPFIYSAARETIAGAKGKATGVSRLSAERELGISETGESTFAGDIGKFSRETFAPLAGQEFAQAGRTTGISGNINEILGTRKLAREVIPGEYQGLVQNVLDRLTIANTLKGGMGRVESLKTGAVVLESPDIFANVPKYAPKQENIWKETVRPSARLEKPSKGELVARPGGEVRAIQRERAPIEEARYYGPSSLQERVPIERVSELLKAPSPVERGRISYIEEEGEYISKPAQNLIERALGKSSETFRVTVPSLAMREIIATTTAQRQFTETTIKTETKPSFDTYIQQITGSKQIEVPKEEIKQDTVITPITGTREIQGTRSGQTVNQFTDSILGRRQTEDKTVWKEQIITRGGGGILPPADLRSGGGAGGPGPAPSGFAYIERLKLRSMREALLGTPTKKKK